MTPKELHLWNVTIAEKGPLKRPDAQRIIDRIHEIIDGVRNPGDILGTALQAEGLDLLAVKMLRNKLSESVRRNKRSMNGVDISEINDVLSGAIFTYAGITQLPAEDLSARRRSTDIRLSLRRKRNRPVYPPGDDRRRGGR